LKISDRITVFFGIAFDFPENPMQSSMTENQNITISIRLQLLIPFLLLIAFPQETAIAS
jgi:hypothetical protein